MNKVEGAEGALFTEDVDAVGQGRVEYGGDRAGWEKEFEMEGDGAGARKTREAIGLFGEYQGKAEELMAKVRKGD